MVFENFISKVEKGLEDLPGEEAQYRMSPLYRPRLSEIQSEVENARRSAVLMLLFPVDSIVHTAFIVRPKYQGVHSGQVAFPGGRVEPHDLDLKHTALRECWEEVGVSPQSVNILGALTPLYIQPSRYLVYPFIGMCVEAPYFVPDGKEVEKILRTPISKVFDPSAKGTFTVTTSSGNTTIKAPGYRVDNHIIWGATAMMLSEVEAILARPLEE